METTICVFSGTGTSLAAAEKIRNNFPDTDILSIAECMQYNNEKITLTAKRIGFIFPCYYNNIPNLVRQFVQRLDISQAEYIFAIVTAGGSFGLCFESLQEELRPKQKKLNYGSALFFSSNYIEAWYYAFVSKHGKRQEKALTKFWTQLTEISENITDWKEHIPKSSNLINAISSKLQSKKLSNDTRLWDRDFQADEQCIHCGVCSKVCLVSNIVMLNKKPTFQHNCQRCMACIQYCPKQAIRIKKKSIHKPRYYHPDYPAIRMAQFIKKQKERFGRSI